jgi:hypothetical protein
MEPLFISKQVYETLVSKKDTYLYIAECIFTKNGVRQHWRYTATLDDNNEVQRTYKRIDV